MNPAAAYRLEIYGVLAALALGGFLYIQHLRHEAAKAAPAIAAQAQAEHTTRVVDHFTTETRVIHEQGEREADVLQTTPGADAQYDPVRRADLCAALGRLRHIDQPCDDSAGPARTVPASDSGGAANAG